MSLNRRNFLHLGITGSALLLANTNMGAKNFVGEFDIEERTIAELQEAMKRGDITSKALVEIYLKRIKDIDPLIASIIEINPDAVKIAEEMDSERAGGKIRSGLHGIPFVIKDNIDTADKMKTTAGSLALIEAPTPKKDAFIVSKLRAAGAVLLAKTNLSEWANFRSQNASSGWSGRGGQTRNPYILDRSPCGSSSGSGAAVSANLAAIALGTETDGSIVCPASINGIVGIKPTLGLVSRSGIIPIAHSQDTAGPMARTVSDAATLLNAIVGKDPDDSVTAQFDELSKLDYTQFLDANSLNGARLGVMRQYFGKNAELDGLMNSLLTKMKAAGAELIDVDFPDLRNYGDDEYQVLLYEFKNDLNKYLAARGGKYDTLKKLIAFNYANAEKELPYFKQEIFVEAQAKDGLESREYRLALLRSKVLTQDKGIDLLIGNYRLDALIAPSNAQSWMIDLINGDSPTNYVSSSSIAAVSGYPNITVPSGFLDKLPIGVSFFGSAFSEPKLISLAFAWEQKIKARKKPTFLPTFK
ncbi:MAG: amidase [Pyrinomonadaceae bacterium]